MPKRKMPEFSRVFRRAAYLADTVALGGEIFSLRRKELPELFHLKARKRAFKAEMGWHMHCTISIKRQAKPPPHEPEMCHGKRDRIQTAPG
jgi:hypothetical protein